MKIKILYSHYNTNQDICLKYRPSWFKYENCFRNFYDTIEGKSGKLKDGIEFHVIYDTTRGELDENWLGLWKENLNIKIHEIVGGSMFGAAKEMYRIAKELSEDMEDDDLFYFMENDYLHLPDWVSEVENLFETFQGLNYMSLYDHNDKYTWMHLYENLTSKIFVTSTRHYRTVPNTCGSYICNKKLFLEDYDIRTTIEGDANVWALLSEKRNRFLLTPIPSLSTHCIETLLAPCIDWKKINDQFN